MTEPESMSIVGTIRGVDVPATADRVSLRLVQDPRELLSLCRAALPSVDLLSLHMNWNWPTVVTRPQLFTFLARCVERVWPLVASHDRFGPVARTAFLAAVDCCLGRRVDHSFAEQGWAGLVKELAGQLATDPVDPALVTGTGHAALANVALLQALAQPDDPLTPVVCHSAAADVTAAFAMVTPSSFQSRDVSRVVQAIVKDLETLRGRSHLDDPTDPGDGGPYGRLWVQEPYPLELAALRAEAAALVRALTSPDRSPTLGIMPTVDGPTTQPELPEEELAELTPPVEQLTVATTLPELAQLPDRLREASAPHVARFREMLVALAGHEFEDRETAARTIRDLQHVRTLLGLRFVFRSEDGEKDGLQVSISFDDDARYKAGVIRAVTTTSPQKKIYNKKSFPHLDVIDGTSKSSETE